MTPQRFACLLTFALAICAWPLAGSSQEHHASLAPSDATIRTACSGELTADRMVLRAAMTVRGVKLLEVSRRLDKQVVALREVVAARDGRLTLHDRIRLAKASGDDEREPLTSIQPFDAEFPIDADVDAIVDAMLPVGVDHFGNAQDMHSGSVPQPIARYRIQNARAQLDAVHSACRVAAARAWCAAHAASRAVECERAFESLLPAVVTRALVLSAGSTTAVGQSDHHPAAAVRYPWSAAGLESLDLVPTRRLRLTGAITMVFPGLPQ